MESFFLDSAFAGVSISLIAYMAGVFLKKKFKIGVFNPHCYDGSAYSWKGGL